MSSSPPPADPSPVPRSLARLRHLGLVLLGLLVVQCIIGFAVTMYVSLPSSPSYLAVFASVPLLTAHIVIALLLLAVALYATALAIRLQVRTIGALQAVATILLLGASEQGLAFSFTANNNDSLGMLGGFVGALILEIVVLLWLSRRARSTTAAAVARVAVSP